MHREANYQWLRSFDFFFSYKKSSRVVVFECRVYWLFGWHVLIILLLLFRFALFINFGLYAVCIRARVKLRRFNSHLAENSFELTVDWSCVCYYCSFDDIYLFFFSTRNMCTIGTPWTLLPSYKHIRECSRCMLVFSTHSRRADIVIIIICQRLFEHK